MSVDRSRAGGLSAYTSFFGRALSSHLAYAGSVWLNLVAAAAGFAFTLFVWDHVQLPGPQRVQFFAYLACAFSLNFTLGISLERIVGERIREGLIATDMLKPVDMPLLFFVQALSDIAFQAFFGLATLGIAYYWLGPAILPASASALGLAALALLSGVFVHFYVSFLFVQMIFLTNSNYGPFSTRMVMYNAFSGLFAPLTVFPAGLKLVAEWLPFKHIIYTPIALYQGSMAGAEAWAALASSVLWALGLFLVSRFSFDRIRRGLSIQGG